MMPWTARSALNQVCYYSMIRRYWSVTAIRVVP